MKSKEIELKIKAKKSEASATAALAVQDIEREISALKEELRVAHCEEMEAKKPLYEGISPLVEEIAGICFRLAIFHKYNMHFEIKQHINSIRLRRVGDPSEYMGDYFDYEKPESILKARDYAKSVLLDFDNKMPPKVIPSDLPF